MDFVANYPNIVKSLIVVDTTPRSRHGKEKTIEYIEAMQKLEKSYLKTRHEAEEFFKTVLPDSKVKGILFLVNLTYYNFSAHHLKDNLFWPT